MLPTPITEQAKQQEWDSICTIAMNNGFPLQIIYNLKNKIIKTLKAKNTPTQTQRKKWITFMYYSPSYTKLSTCSNTPTKHSISNVTPYTINYMIETHKTKQTLVEYTDYNAKHATSHT
jgi:hypothetical protein